MLIVYNLKFRVSLDNVYMHGKPYSLTDIKMPTDIIARIQYHDDLYRPS